MVYTSPTCRVARALKLPERCSECWSLPDHATNQRTLRHIYGCVDCDAYTAMKLGHDEVAAVRTESSSRPGVWYVTTPNACTCPGFSYRGKCRHIEGRS